MKFKNRIISNLKFAYPIFLGQIGFTLSGFFDNIMVSKLGTIPLASFSLANNLLFLFFSLNLGFTIMITPMISEKYHKGEIENIISVFFNGSLVYIVVGMLLFIVLMIIGQNLDILGQSDSVINLAKPYFKIITISFIPSFLFQILKHFADGMGKTKIAMYAIIISIALNIILNYGLIFGKFGFKSYGLIGAGYGSLISRCVLLIFVFLSIWHNSETNLVLKNFFKSAININEIKNILKLSTFSSFQIFFKILLIATSVIISGNLGSTFQASNQVLLSLSSLIFSIPFSLAIASAIIVSTIPAKDFTFAIKATQLSFLSISLFFSLIFGFSLIFFRFDIISLYSNSRNVINILCISMFILAAFQIFDSLETITLGMLRGLQDTIYPFIITASTYVCVSIPLAIILSKKFELIGIWIGISAGAIISLMLVSLRLKYLLKKNT